MEVKEPFKANRSENDANSATRACYRSENNFDGIENRSDSNRVVSGRIDNDIDPYRALGGGSENYAYTATTSGGCNESDIDRSESDVDTGLFIVDGLLTEESRPGTTSASSFTYYSNSLSYASNGQSDAGTAFPKHSGSASDVRGRVAKPHPSKSNFIFYFFTIKTKSK